MAWETEMVRIVRHLINDIVEPYKYDDNRLQELILVSAQLAQKDVQFAQEYVIDVDELRLTPDPTSRNPDTREDAFINLVCMKATCLLANSEYKQASGQAVSIADGQSRLDLKGIADSKKGFAKDICSQYEDAKLQYALGVLSAGEAIVGPFKFMTNHSTSGYCRRESDGVFY